MRKQWVLVFKKTDDRLVGEVVAVNEAVAQLAPPFLLVHSWRDGFACASWTCFGEMPGHHRVLHHFFEELYFDICAASGDLRDCFVQPWIVFVSCWAQMIKKSSFRRENCLLDWRDGTAGGEQSLAIAQLTRILLRRRVLRPDVKLKK